MICLILQLFFLFAPGYFAGAGQVFAQTGNPVAAEEGTAGTAEAAAEVPEDCESLPPAPAPAPVPLPPVSESASAGGEASLGRVTTPNPTPSSGAVIKAILGFIGLLVLAYLGGHRWVHEMERKLKIAHLVTAGLPFVILGAIARRPEVGILSDSVLREIGPLLPLGLGWIGFAVGFRFDARLLNVLPRGTGSAVLLTTIAPFLATVAGCSLILLWSSSSAGTFLRDALLLGTAAAMTARSASFLLESRGAGTHEIDRLTRVVQIEQLAGVFGLMLVAAYFRPQGEAVAWHLPGTAWLFITLGIGATMGGVIYATLHQISLGPQFSVVLLGSVCFAAGMASFLRLSPVAVCFIAGLILVNFPSTWKERVREVLDRLERPIYFLFLVIAGALWRRSDWEGWALMVIFVTMRFLGKWLGIFLCRRSASCELGPEERRTLVLAPIGALSIAIVVNAQDLYSGPTISWIVTAVIGGAIVMEIILQIFTRRPRQETESAPPDTAAQEPKPAMEPLSR